MRLKCLLQEFVRMENRLTLKYPVVVEGKYDKVRLENIISSPVITLDGFAVLNNKNKKQLLRRVSGGGIIILTDSDSAGMLIRSKLRSVLDPEKTFHVYIPRVSGTEKRKTRPSAEGFLGVEGMDSDTLYRLLLPFAGDGIRSAGIDYITFWRDGYSGSDGSAAKRRALAKRLSLPENLSSKALLEAVNLTLTYEEYRSISEE